MAKDKRTFQDRLREIINRYSNGVVRRFAEAVGINHQAVHNWLDGESQPNSKALIGIWNVYRVDPLWLMTGEPGVKGPVVLRVTPPHAPKGEAGAAEQFLESEIERDRFVSVPLLADAIAAGSPREIRAQDIEDFAIIYADWLPQPEMVTCVRVAGDSMSPILTDGSIVAIDHSQRDAKKLDGKMVAFRKDGGASVKWCQYVSPDLVMGLPENKDTRHTGGLLVFKDDEVNECVVGRVAWWWGLPKK